jgi:hypothetical protein
LVFYFHVRCGDDFIEDCEGLSCASLAVARTEAIAGARDLLAEDVKHGRFNINQRFELTDATGRLRLTIPFQEAVDVVALLGASASAPLLRGANG